MIGFVIYPLYLQCRDLFVVLKSQYCHPEFISGSIFLSQGILKQVQDDNDLNNTVSNMTSRYLIIKENK